MLTRLQQFLHDRKLKRYQTTNLHKVRDGHFENLGSIGIVFDATNTENHKSINKLTKQLRKEFSEVQVLGFFNSKEDPGSHSFAYFNLSGVGFSKTPTSDVANQFVDKQFDILVSLDFQGHAPLNYICAASQALFKVGPASANPDHFDLMIDMGESYRIRDMFEEISKTLNIIH